MTACDRSTSTSKEPIERCRPAGHSQLQVHCTSGISNASCVENAECFSSGDYGHIANLRKAVASILFLSGRRYYICSGGLINNAADNPLFPTANHCINRSGEANSLEAYWNHTAPCGTQVCDAGTSTCSNSVTVSF